MTVGFLESVPFHLKKIIGITHILNDIDLGPVVQTMVSVTISLRGQLVKCFTTLLPNIHIFLLRKLEKLLHCKSFSHFFNKKFWQFSVISI